MEIFKLAKPDIGGKVDQSLEILKRYAGAMEYVANANHPVYLYWDKVRYKHPPEMTAEEFWALLKILRQYSPGRTRTEVRDEAGSYFSWQPLRGLDHFLHKVDLNLGGILASPIVDNSADRQKYISRNIMEEAIASSQLEGASTTRVVAKQMLLEQRKPRNSSEQMILNNYNAMLEIDRRLQHEELTLDTFLHLHGTIVKDTIDSSEVGRLRQDIDKVVVSDSSTGLVYHIPPSEKFLREEIRKFIRFANDSSESDVFVHPILKATILHFWVGYLHPFTDGNGRMARAISSWYLLRKGYWAFAYLPLSKYIKNSPAQYRDAYIYSEQDDNDLTYFIDFSIRKITQATREFESYVERKQHENRTKARMARARYDLNDRQIQLLQYLHKHPEAPTTIKTHSSVYEVSRVTARKDLEELERMGLLESRKIGRERPFRATKKTAELLS